MGRYDNDFDAPQARQRDLVLSTNEFCFLQSKTNGAIKTYTGPITMTISAQESLVVFDPKSKRFVETTDFNAARQLFVSAPEGWYVVLKNPSDDGTHPEVAKAVNSPALQIGKKVMVPGPTSFSLYPGQMAKVVRGHRLRSNQYLLARVYDADAAEKNIATIVDSDGNEVKSNDTKYFVGQLLVIKGTEVSFYMPPTGIEVVPVEGTHDQYVRDAVTLERLEYTILKDEDGEKVYKHGPAVVFPEPTQTFVESPKGGVIFRALELSPISGIYVKVIADYKDEDGAEHKTGEELFITGNEQMIYYPRPEHAMIQYDGKYMHHAIAIPEGEGRYVLDRLNGTIKTVIGPTMYLPDPRTEVVVKRKLTEKECELFYPGNREALEYNIGLSEKKMERMANKGLVSANAITDTLNTAYSTSNQLDTLAIFEANANISRGVSYTKPRTITLDTKYDGVVSVDVWSGYAITVVSKTGNREVVVGPQTRLLDYDETLESIETPTGETAFLKISNNSITEAIHVQTKDFVDAEVRLTYNVDFDETKSNDWFSIKEYPTYLKATLRNAIKQTVKAMGIMDFYTEAPETIRESINTFMQDYSFENGMIIKDVEINQVLFDPTIARMIQDQKTSLLQKNMDLINAQASMSVIIAQAEADKKAADLKHGEEQYQMQLANELELTRLANREATEAKERELDIAKNKAKADMQSILDTIAAAQLERQKAEQELEAVRQRELASIEAEKQKAYAETVQKIMDAISPDLIAALSTKANAELLTEATKNMSPYAIAKGESVADTINTLMRGTSLENILKQAVTTEE